jgi:hypothetical protein
MALPTNTTYSGDRRPILKYDARSRLFSLPNRVQQPDGSWITRTQDLTSAVFVFDFPTLEVGWVGFPGGRPDFRMAAFPLNLQLSGGTPTLAARPADLNEQGNPVFNMGFRLNVMMGNREVREFSHSALCVYNAFSKLHDQFIAAAEAKAGQVPVVQVASYEAIKAKMSTNYAPVFKIGKWIDRPVELIEADEPALGGAEPFSAAVGDALAVFDGEPVDLGDRSTDAETELLNF